jgi:hypothetical protein
MAALRGVLTSDNSNCSRISTTEIHADLNTHKGKVRTVLFYDGTCKVFVNDELVYNGTVDMDEARYKVACEVIGGYIDTRSTLSDAVRLAERAAENYYNTYGSSQYIVVKEGDYTVHAVRYEPKEGGCFIVPEVFA